MRDLTIYGAGVIGLSIAFTCLRRGARVSVIDPGGPGAGASGGIVGALAPHVPQNWNAKKAFQLDSLFMAEDFWRDVEETGGALSGYKRTGRLQPVEGDNALALAQDRAANARCLWRGLAHWDVAPASDFEFAPLTNSGFVIHDTLTARLHPRRACASLAAAISALGGDIQTQATPRGYVIDATGTAGLEWLSEQLGREVGTGIKGQAALLDFAAPESPQIFADTIHIVPHADGTTAIGSTSERDYVNPASTDRQLDDVIERARQAQPALLRAPVLARWAGLRPRSRSRAPMLGPCPVRKNHFIANGGFKIGFGMAPKIADVMADFVLENRDSIPADFRVEASLPAVAQ